MKLGGGWKNRETVTASHCLVFEGRAKTLSPRLIESNKKYIPQRYKTCQIEGNTIVLVTVPFLYHFETKYSCEIK